MISRLQYITQDLPGVSHAKLAGEACRAGVNWIQLRVKNRSCTEWKAIALETQAVCRKYGAKLIINDSMTLANEIGADGVHLGQKDISTAEARRILGKEVIIGGTANTLEDIREHARAGADYIGLGPFRFTRTKENLSPVLGLDGYSEILHQCRLEKILLPVIAIGGILPGDVTSLLNTGVYGVAVSGVITQALDKKRVVAGFMKHLKTEKHETT